MSIILLLLKIKDTCCKILLACFILVIFSQKVTIGQAPNNSVVYSNLSLEPVIAKPGQPVLISIDVNNREKVPTEVRFKLYINGSLESEHAIALKPYENKTVSLPVSRFQPGPYSVRINSESHNIINYSEEVGSFATSKFPRAVRAGEYTYYGYVGFDGRIIINKRNRKNGEIISTILGKVQSIDDHSSPYIYVNKNGRIFVWWYDRKSRNTIHQARSIHPFGMKFEHSHIPVRRVDYPIAFHDGGALYLIYRSDHHGGKWQFIKSYDEGQTWTSPILFYEGSAWPYLHTFQDSIQEGLHIVRGGQTIHSNDFNVYYIYLNNGNFYSANRTHLGSIEDMLPLSETSMEIIKSADKERQRAMEVLEHEGRMYVLIASNITAKTGPDGNYIYERAHFSQRKNTWIIEKVVESNYGGPGTLAQFPLYATMNQANPDLVYGSVYRPEKDQIDIGLFSRQSDESWKRIDWITESPENDIIPQAVRYTDDELLWHRGNYKGFTDFNTQIFGTQLRIFMVKETKN